MVRYPKSISNEMDLQKIHASEVAILKNAPSPFVCRIVIPGLDKPDSEIRIYSLIKRSDGTYQAETTKLKIKNDAWVLNSRFKSEVTAENGSKCQLLFRQSVLNIRYSGQPISGGFDVPIVLWECANEGERSVILQALQFSEPKEESNRKNVSFIQKILMEN